MINTLIDLVSALFLQIFFSIIGADCAQSIIGQVLKRARPTPFYFEKDWDTARIEKVAKTIAIFSLGGLQEVKKQLVDITDHTTKECSNECE
jgi:hypothetical protein